MGRLSQAMQRMVYVLWGEPPARVVARQDLEETKRLFLSNQTKAEYHTQMNAVYRSKIKRLEDFLKAEEQQ